MRGYLRHPGNGCLIGQEIKFSSIQSLIHIKIFIECLLCASIMNVCCLFSYRYPFSLPKIILFPFKKLPHPSSSVIRYFIRALLSWLGMGIARTIGYSFLETCPAKQTENGWSSSSLLQLQDCSVHFCFLFPKNSPGPFLLPNLALHPSLL